jgi:hypothetical protein
MKKGFSKNRKMDIFEMSKIDSWNKRILKYFTLFTHELQ